MSRGGRRDYSGSSPAASGASAHSGRDQHYHDDFTRGGGGRGRGDGRGGNFNKDANRGPGGRPEKRMGKFETQILREIDFGEFIRSKN